MRKDALDIFTAGVNAVKAEAAVRRHCSREADRFMVDQSTYDLSRFKDIYVIGAGKAGGSMAKALEEILGDRITAGVVVVKYGHVAPLSKVRLVEAGHPVPDSAGLEGARAVLEMATRAQGGDLVICVLSGGGSALLPLPVKGVSLADKQAVTKVLLACGATIHEINAVRKHLSLVKGGGLARAVSPAVLVTLILSDVVGDDLDVIASGPTVPDSSTFATCMEVFERYNISDKVPAAVSAHIRRGLEGKAAETPKPGDTIFEGTRSVIVGSNVGCILAAEKKALALGYRTIILSSMLEGETADVARVHAGIAKEILKTGHPVSSPACVLSGGETTVTLKGAGLGGRNQEFVLAGAIALSGWRHVVVLSGGTDGTDGPTDAAGAVADGLTDRRAREMGLVPEAFLADNDAYHFFERLGDLIKTGPTDTNVMDLRVLLVVAGGEGVNPLKKLNSNFGTKNFKR
ncbi:MAG: glycerate kinase [Deltaproteobacteria bacterium]|nr:glycerate kinase [Deltaproteobacteria bacterium]